MDIKELQKEHSELIIKHNECQHVNCTKFGGNRNIVELHNSVFVKINLCDEHYQEFTNPGIKD